MCWRSTWHSTGRRPGRAGRTGGRPTSPCDRWRISGPTPNSDPRRMRCLPRPGARARRAPGASRSSSAPRPAWARPTRCFRPPTPSARRASTSSSAWSRRTGARRRKRCWKGLEILPRKPMVYVNRILDEFDIDAALRRRPGLVLVDELAHTNVAGSRHPKRYQDVEELLDAGIDVYTTVNIQHIESLNDVVAQITRVRVREIVPDAIVDRADAIELVDLTPEDLIQRLEEGKVYVPKQAERALKNYFSPANLTALRELALRRTAERVDEQLLEQMQRARHPRAVGGRRADSGVRQRGPALGGPRALCQAAGRPAARALDGAVPRDAAQPAVQRGAARPGRRDAAAGRAPRRRGRHAAAGLAAHRRGRAELRAQEQRHAHHHRQIDALALVRDPARLGRARAGTRLRQHQRPRDRRRGARGGAQRQRAP